MFCVWCANWHAVPAKNVNFELKNDPVSLVAQPLGILAKPSRFQCAKMTCAATAKTSQAGKRSTLLSLISPQSGGALRQSSRWAIVTLFMLSVLT